MYRGACTYNPKYTINIGDKLKLINDITSPNKCECNEIR